MDQEKLSLLKETVKELQAEFHLTLPHALLLASQMELHDRLCEVRDEIRNLYIYEDETAPPPEPWEKKDDGA